MYLFFSVILLISLSLLANWGRRNSKITFSETRDWGSSNPLWLRMVIFVVGYFWFGLYAIIFAALLGLKYSLILIYTFGISIPLAILVIFSYPLSMYRWFSEDHLAFWHGLKELIWAMFPFLNIGYVWDIWSPFLYPLANFLVITFYDISFGEFAILTVSVSLLSLAIVSAKRSQDYPKDYKDFIATLSRTDLYLRNQLRNFVIQADSVKSDVSDS